MKVQTIHIKNLGVHAYTRLTLDKPVAMFLGAQESGKSTIAEALCLALTGQALRVSRAKDLPHLIGPEDKGFDVTATVDDQEYGGRVTKSSKTLSPMNGQDPVVLHSLLEARRLSQMNEEERRRLFLRFLGELDRERQLDLIWQNATDYIPDTVKAVMPNIGAMGQAAVQLRRELKRRVDVPVAAAPDAMLYFNDRELDLSTIPREDVVSQINGLAMAISKAHQQTVETPEKVAKAQDEHHKLRREAGEAANEVSRLRGQGDNPICPVLGKKCARISPEKMEGLIEQAAARHRKLQEKVEVDEKKLERLAAPVLKKRKEAEGEIQALEDRKRKGQVLLSHIDEYQRKVRAFESRQEEDRTMLMEQLARVDLLANYIQKSLRTDLLQGPMEKIRERVAFTSRILPGHQVVVEDDLRVTVDGRPVDLCSESEQFRVWFIIQEALAHLSGLRFLLVDRLELMRGPFQRVFLQTIDQLAAGYDTIILMATADEPPDSGPKNFSIFWVDRGQVRQVV